MGGGMASVHEFGAEDMAEDAAALPAYAAVGAARDDQGALPVPEAAALARYEARHTATTSDMLLLAILASDVLASDADRPERTPPRATPLRAHTPPGPGRG